MEGAEQSELLADLNLGSVAKLGAEVESRFAQSAEGIESRVKADFPQAKDDPKIVANATNWLGSNLNKQQ